MAAMRVESIDALRARKADRRTEVSDLQMELTARKSDALRLVIDSQPYLARLELIAHEVGPTAEQTVMGLRARLNRYVVQWDDDNGGSAA